MQLLELTVRVLCDVAPLRRPDAAYVYAQTEDNQQSVFFAAAALIRHDLIGHLLIPRSEARNGYPGFEKWSAGLEECGVPRDRIVAAPAEEFENLNTRTEAQAAVRFARQAGYRVMYVIAAPFHQLRAFSSMVSVALEEYPELFLYSSPGPSLSWQQKVVHSQGTLTGTRSEIIHSELERIQRYQQKGDLAPTEALLKYLDWRDAL